MSFIGIIVFVVTERNDEWIFACYIFIFERINDVLTEMPVFTVC